MTAAPTRLRRKILAAVLAPLLALAALEGFVRVAGIVPKRGDAPLVSIRLERQPEFPNRWDDELLWSMEPGRAFPWAAAGRWGDERVNAQGLRGPAAAPAKPAGTRRVLLLGDSCTFGSGVAESATFAHRLRRWLATDPEGRWEVVNAGVPGYSLWQMDRFFMLRGLALEPDVVVVYAGAWNDYAPANGAPDSALADRVRASREGLGRLRLVQLLRGLIPASKSTSNSSPSFGARVPREEFSTLLRELHLVCSMRGTPLIAIVPPAQDSIRQDHPDGEAYAEDVRRVARERDLSMVDARKAFADTSPSGPDLFLDGLHPSDEGHRLLFEGVAAAISRLPLNPRPPPRPASIEPIDLRKMLSRCHLRIGTPLLPADLSVLAEKDGVVSIPVPFELRFDDLPIPPQASFFADIAPGIARPARPDGTVFRILVGVSGAESRPVASRTYPIDRPLFIAENVGADLSALAGTSVTLVLECTGAATTVLLANAGVHAWR